MTPRKLTPAEVAQLGGFGRARTLSPARRSEIARNAQAAWAAKYGKEGRVRLQHARWGRLTKTENATGSTAALSQTNEGDVP